MPHSIRKLPLDHEAVPGTMDVMELELLVVAGCPHESPAGELFRAALARTGAPDHDLRVTIIADEEEAYRRQFTGSPTFLVNGADPFAPLDAAIGLTCRLYRRGDGTVAGLPELDGLLGVLVRAQPNKAGM